MVHMPTEACERWHCYSHHVDEPDGYYRCVACGHGWDSGQALVQAYRAQAHALARAKAAGYTQASAHLPRHGGGVPYCPLCRDEL